MKKIALTALALVVSAGSAFAADLPSRKAPILPPPPPPPMWTGFYVGLNAGYAFDNGSGVRTTGLPGYGTFDALEATDGAVILPGAASALSLAGFAPMNNGGFIGGGQVGYNYQFAGNFVVGLEADIQGTTQKSNGNAYGVATAIYDDYAEQTGFATTARYSKSLPWIGTVRARIGYLVTPTLLVYGTGGLAYGGVSASASFQQAAYNVKDTEYNGAGVSGSNLSNTVVGWAAGGGLEWMFMPSWTLKVEGIYYDLGSSNWNSFVLNTGTAPFDDPAYKNLNTFATAQHNANFSGTIARAGVNYHFNWDSAPVVAKY